MTLTSANELQEIRDCREYSCTRDASDSPRTGPYANRCTEHRETMRVKMIQGARRSHASRGHGTSNGTDPGPPLHTPPAATPLGTPSSLGDSAKALVKPSVALDRALLRKRFAESEVVAARSVLAEAVRVFQAAVEETGF